MDNGNFWLWTLFFVVLCYLFVQILCICTSYRPSERTYYETLLEKRVPSYSIQKTHDNKIDSENI